MGFLFVAWAYAPSALRAAGTDVGAKCVKCHAKVTPNVVNDWKLSEHSSLGIGCDSCHGSEHLTPADAAKAKLPTAETCGQCHADRLEQFKKGKHALAWAAMEAMPTIHYQPMAMTEGMKGCGGCHKIGLKSPEQVAELAKSGVHFGNASCDSCHTRHTFSIEEAKSAQAEFADMPDLPHAGRKSRRADGLGIPRGVVADAGRQGLDGRPRNGAASVGSADPSGQPTKLLELVKAADVARLDQTSWQAERDRMVKACNQWHSVNFAKEQLQHGDGMIKNADHLMAHAIREVARLYKDGVLAKPASYAYAFPNLLTFHDAPTVVEQKLFVMFLEHRMRTFQGTFHASPDYALWSDGAKCNGI